MREVSFVDGNFYHIYNRGVARLPIFLDESDYARFVHDLYEFNDVHPALDARVKARISEVGPPRLRREPVVAILAWCLMPNHFHLLLQQRIDNGVSFFMKKLGTGFTMYMNQKYERSGHVFQGKFRAKHIDTQGYLLHISRYIHLNSIDLVDPNWKEQGIRDWGSVQKFLEEFRWSSYQDWIGKKNFPSVLNRSGIDGLFKGSEDYKRFISEWAARDYHTIRGMLADSFQRSNLRNVL